MLGDRLPAVVRELFGLFPRWVVHGVLLSATEALDAGVVAPAERAELAVALTAPEKLLTQVSAKG